MKSENVSVAGWQLASKTHHYCVQQQQTNFSSAYCSGVVFEADKFHSISSVATPCWGPDSKWQLVRILLSSTSHTHTHDSSRPVFSVDIILLDTDSGNVTGSKQIPTCKHIFIRVSQSFISIMTSFSFDEVSLPVRNKLFPKYVHLRVHLYLSGH